MVNLLLGGRGQFGPDLRPVVRAKVPARHCAIGCAFDGHTISRRRLSIAISMLPLLHLRNAGPDGNSQIGGRNALRRIEIGFKVHGQIVVAFATCTQLLFATGAFAMVLL